MAVALMQPAPPARMFWSRKVKVTLVDADSGSTVAESSLPPEQLPESFEAHTTLTLGDQSWEVVKAEPMTRAEYARSRALRLTVRPLNVEPEAQPQEAKEARKKGLKPGQSLPQAATKS